MTFPSIAEGPGPTSRGDVRLVADRYAVATAHGTSPERNAHAYRRTGPHACAGCVGRSRRRSARRSSSLVGHRSHGHGRMGPLPGQRGSPSATSDLVGSRTSALSRTTSHGVDALTSLLTFDRLQHSGGVPRQTNRPSTSWRISEIQHKVAEPPRQRLLGTCRLMSLREVGVAGMTLNPCRHVKSKVTDVLGTRPRSGMAC